MSTAQAGVTEEVKQAVSQEDDSKKNDIASLKYYGVTAHARVLSAAANAQGASENNDSGEEDEQLRDLSDRVFVKKQTIIGDGAKKKILGGKREKSKYEIAVLYTKSTGGIGAKKIYCGQRGALDHQTADPKLRQTQRERYRRILVDHPDFDKEVFLKAGSFLNTKFWDINLSWLEEDDFADALQYIDAKLKIVLDDEFSKGAYTLN